MLRFDWFSKPMQCLDVGIHSGVENGDSDRFLIIFAIAVDFWVYVFFRNSNHSSACTALEETVSDD